MKLGIGGTVSAPDSSNFARITRVQWKEYIENGASSWKKLGAVKQPNSLAAEHSMALR